MKHKAAKPLKRTTGAAQTRPPGNARGVRAVRSDDLGDRRLRLLLGAKASAQ